jgi:hypothetical protein
MYVTVSIMIQDPFYIYWIPVFIISKLASPLGFVLGLLAGWICEFSTLPAFTIDARQGSKYKLSQLLESRESPLVLAGGWSLTPRAFTSVIN